MEWLREHVLERGQASLVFWALAVGVLSGCAAVAFRAAATDLPLLLWPGSRNLVEAVARAPGWRRLLLPAAGGLAAGLILMLGKRWSGPAKGWDILEAVVLRDGVLHFRPTLVHCASSLVTVSSAGAVGREGPMVLLAATVASFTGRRFAAATRHLRTLAGCGIAAGIACAYNAPIGAALFTTEIIFGSFALEVFAPLVFSSVAATLIAHAVFGNTPLFPVPGLAMAGVWEIPAYAGLGLLGGAAAALFLYTLRFSAQLFRRSSLPRPLAMSLAGLVLGVVVLQYPEVVGNGREAIEQLFARNWGLSLALTLLLARLTVTSLMVGSGAVGGVFTPTLLLGALLGNAFGSALERALPGQVADPTAYALVGMGALLAGTTHAPLTAAVMCFEMSLDYNLVLPLLVASAAGAVVARAISRESVYTEALSRKRGELSGEGAVVCRLTVRDVMRHDQVTVPAEVALPELLDRFLSSGRRNLYVVGAGGRLAGVVGIQDMMRALKELRDPAALTAAELANEHFQVAVPDERLDRVMERFWAAESGRLPVVESRASRKLIGTVSQRDILSLCSLETLHRRSSRGAAPSDAGEGEAESLGIPADYSIGELPAPPSTAGRSLAEVRFRERYGLTLLLVRRGAGTDAATSFVPDGATRLAEGDRLVVFGPRERLDALSVRTSELDVGAR